MLQKTNHRRNYSSWDVPDSYEQLLTNRPESAAILESERFTEQQWTDAVIWWSFSPMSPPTLCTAAPACHLVTYLSLQENTMTSASLPCSSNLAAHYLLIYRSQQALKSVCHAARRDRAVADSQLLCHQPWLSQSPAAWLSSNVFPCCPFLTTLTVQSGKWGKVLSRT